jgi:hypothetical protein
MTKPRLLIAAALLTTAMLVAGCSAGAATDTSGAPASAGAAGADAAGSSAPATGAAAASAAASPAANPTGTYRDQIIAWGRRFAACARARGIPRFPDPVYPADWGPNGPNDGNTLFPERYMGTALFPLDKGQLVRALDACTDVARQEPPAPDSLRPPTARELAIMRQFSQCMRRHGYSDFPDPHSDGTFPIAGGPYDSLLPYRPDGSRQLINAYLACDTDHMPVRAS